jgi:hypothetical protein
LKRDTLKPLPTEVRIDKHELETDKLLREPIASSVHELFA